MVLLVLLALMFIGIPFVASMLLKEKSNKNSLFASKSRIAATSARNYAIGSLIRSHSSEESKPTAVAPFNTPDYDTRSELFPREMTYTYVADPKGVIWSARVWDEQSKVNIAGLYKAAQNHKSFMDNLRTLLKPTDKLEDFLTEHSYRPTPWADAMTLLGYTIYRDFRGEERCILYLPRQSYWFNENGVKMRLTMGNREFIAMVSCQPCSGNTNPPCLGSNRVYPVPLEYCTHDQRHLYVAQPYPVREEKWQTGALPSVYVDRRVPDEFLTEWTTVETEQPYAVNVNTASQEALTALLWEVGTRYYDAMLNRVEDRRISLGTAQALAALMKQTYFRNQEDWIDFIYTAYQGRIIERDQASNLWLSSRYPRSFLYDMVDERFTGTFPFCFRSFDTYKIHSAGVINLPSGLEAVRTVFKDVMEVSPSQGLKFALESQYDFDEQFNMLMGNSKRFITYPEWSTIKMTSYDPDTTTFYAPDYSHSSYPQQEAGELKLKTAEDTRGSDMIYNDPFNDTHEGYEFEGTPLTYDSADGFRFPTDLTNKPDIYPGGIELWVKFSASPAGYIADIRQREYENQISISYNNGELTLTVCDAGAERKSARVVAQVALLADVWYHIGAYFEGTQYSSLALFLDGKPVGSFAHYTDTDQPILTELMADLPDTVTINPNEDLIIAVKDTSNFPPSGVIQVGGEAIEYTEISGGGFKVWTAWNMGFIPPQVVTGRGRRGTAISAHPAGAKVTLFGYSNPLEPQITIGGYPPINLDPLPLGGATLTEGMIDTMPTSNIVNPPNGIDAAEVIITVTSVANFPDQGYLRIGGNEAVFYTGRDTSENLFLGCVRGSLGTTASVQVNGSPVELYSIRVSDNTNYPSPCLIQIDDEWIGPVQWGDTPEYFTGVVNGTTPMDMNRGAYNAATPHTPGRLIIPVLAARYATVGPGDTVTLVEDDQTTNPKEIKQIRNALGTLFAFFDNVGREYPVDGITRLLKFPSDELPSYLANDFYLGSPSDDAGAIAATVDELKFFSGDQLYRVISDTLLASSTNDRIMIPNIGTRRLSTTGGLIKLGDEVIGYAGVDFLTNEITGCVRGYLDSPVQDHDYKERMFYIPYLAVTAITSDIGPNDYQIPVVSFRGFPSNDAGYILIGNQFNQSEMVGYLLQQTVMGRNLFIMPYDRTQAGLFRGTFGTTANTYQQDTLVYAMPFRYWHLEKRQAFHQEMAYFQTAHFSRDAVWQKVRWTERHEPASDGMVQWRFLVRFDTKPHWAEAPTNRKDGLFEFFGRIIGSRGSEIEREQTIDIQANQVELLAFVQYNPGAFFTDAWKRAPFLTNLYIDYTRPNTIISHQEE